MIFQEKENQKLDTNIIMRMSTDDKERLKKLAGKVNLPASALIRIAVNEFEKNYMENN